MNTTTYLTDILFVINRNNLLQLYITFISGDYELNNLLL